MIIKLLFKFLKKMYPIALALFPVTLKWILAMRQEKLAQDKYELEEQVGYHEQGIRDLERLTLSMTRQIQDSMLEIKKEHVLGRYMGSTPATPGFSMEAHIAKVVQIGDSFLDLMSKKEPHKEEDVDLQNLLAGVLAELGPRSSARIKVHKLPTVQGDPFQLHWFFLNILTQCDPEAKISVYSEQERRFYFVHMEVEKKDQAITLSHVAKKILERNHAQIETVHNKKSTTFTLTFQKTV